MYSSGRQDVQQTYERDSFFFLCLVRFLAIEFVCTLLAHCGHGHFELSTMIEATSQMFF